MNFLAHLYLSPKDKEIILGNFIADSVKGKTFEKFSPKIKQGILLHREIDQFSDHHKIFKKSKQRLSEKYRMYSGVIVDIFYDHFLSKNWSDYSNKNLKLFVSENYLLLVNHFEMLPPRSKRILPFMISQNWLVNYASLTHLNKVFFGMSRRTHNSSKMLTAVDDLKESYELFETEFKIFFPDIINYIQSTHLYKSLVDYVITKNTELIKKNL